MCVVGVAACAVVEISVATTASGYHVTELMLSTSASVATALERISRTQPMISTMIRTLLPLLRAVSVYDESTPLKSCT